MPIVHMHLHLCTLWPCPLCTPAPAHAAAHYAPLIAPQNTESSNCSYCPPPHQGWVVCPMPHQVHSLATLPYHVVVQVCTSPCLWAHMRNMELIFPEAIGQGQTTNCYSILPNIAPEATSTASWGELAIASRGTSRKPPACVVLSWETQLGSKFATKKQQQRNKWMIYTSGLADKCNNICYTLPYYLVSQKFGFGIAVVAFLSFDFCLCYALSTAPHFFLHRSSLMIAADPA